MLFRSLRAAYLRIIGAIALFTFPTMAGVYAVADDFVLVVFGPKWMEMVPVLKVVCWVVMLQSVAATASTILLSKGDSKILFRLSVVSALFMAIALIIGSRWGLIGTAIAYSCVALLDYSALIYFSTKKIGVSVASFLRTLRGSFLAAMGMSFLVLTVAAQLSEIAAVWRLVVSISNGIVCYLILTYILNRRDSRDILKLLLATWLRRRGV